MQRWPEPGRTPGVGSRESETPVTEVKTRRQGSGAPWDSLHLRKRAQVRRMATAYLNREPQRPRGSSLRFDAIGVVLRADGALVGLEHLEGAF